jgi:hypothetical protein
MTQSFNAALQGSESAPTRKLARDRLQDQSRELARTFPRRDNIRPDRRGPGTDDCPKLGKIRIGAAAEETGKADDVGDPTLPGRHDVSMPGAV